MRQRFARVVALGRTLERVEVGTRYDRSPVLRVSGCFMAGLARHASAEPDSLVVRMTIDDRTLAIEDAPDIYYVTDYYQSYPVVLARLSRLSDDALRDLLAMSWQLTQAKARGRQKGQGNR